MEKEDLVKEYRVREILEAARRVVGRFGFEGTTLDRVAEEAGIAKGTVYLYFKNKDELLHSAVIEGVRELTRELHRNDKVFAPPVERLAGIIREVFRQENAHQDFLKALILNFGFVTYKPGNPRDEELRQVYFGMLDYFASVIGPAMESFPGQPLDPQLAAFMLNEMMTGSLRRRMLGITDAPPEADAEAVIELFLYGIRGIRGFRPERSQK